MAETQVKRFERNGILTTMEQGAITQKKVLVVGCGGLGCYVLEQLARLGVGRLSVVDPDTFTQSNLNRQLYSSPANLGHYKVHVARGRLNEIAPEAQIEVAPLALTAENADQLVRGCHVVVDALDDNGVRLILAQACERAGLPMVHGAIAGWYGQVMTVLPGRGTQAFQRLLSRGHKKGIEVQIGNPSFTPGLVASYQVAEVLKILIVRGSLMSEHLLMIDLLDNEVTFIALANPL